MDLWPQLRRVPQSPKHLAQPGPEFVTVLARAGRETSQALASLELAADLGIGVIAARDRDRGFAVAGCRDAGPADGVVGAARV